MLKRPFKKKKKVLTRINCQIVVEISKHASSSVAESHEGLMVEFSVQTTSVSQVITELPLYAFIYSFFFSFRFSSLLISLLAMDVYFVMMPYWFRPGRSSRKLTVGRERKAPIRNRRTSYQTAASSSNATAQIIWPFIFSRSRNFVIWRALNYSCEHKLVKSGFRRRTSCLPSGSGENMVASQ